MTQTPFPPPDLAPDPAPAVRCRIAGPQTWALVREDYLSGVPARVCAQRYGVGESNLKRRAREEGWRKCDQARRIDAQRFAAATGATPPPDPGPAPDVPDAAQEAAREAARRVARGDGRGALDLLKASDALIENAGHVLAYRQKVSDQLETEIRLARDKAAQAEERQRSDERRREFAREAEIREAEHQALLARLRAQAPIPDPAPAQPEAAEPEASAAEPPGKPKLSFEERVRLASGKSGPETRW